MSCLEKYRAIKADVSPAILLFRLGDFFEAMEADAPIVAKALDITLTKRGDVPMCGVPAHSVQRYADDLRAAGHAVELHDGRP